jgi:hypothetical protein
LSQLRNNIANLRNNINGLRYPFEFINNPSEQRANFLHSFIRFDADDNESNQSSEHIPPQLPVLDQEPLDEGL